MSAQSRVSTVLATALLSASALTSAAHAQFPAATGLVSVAHDGGSALGNSDRPVLSHDGRYVAFASDATNLVRGDTNENRDVFVRDLVTGITERVSLSWKGQEGRGDSDCPSISADGRYVAFRSWAWNLYAGGANLGSVRWDVYRRDRVAGTTTRLSVGHDGSEPDGESGCPSISNDGSRVVFDSNASNLVPENPEYPSDVFLWDDTEGIALLTVPLDGVHHRAYGSEPVISGDGNTVAFSSGSRDLIPNPPGGNIDRVYVLDLSTGVMTHESVSDSGVAGWRPARMIALSDDGRYVSFVTGSRNYMPVPLGQGGGTLYLRDRTLGTLTLVSPARPGLECGPPDARFPCRMDPVTSQSMSADGRFIVFASRSTNFLPGSTHKGDQVYAWDRVTERLRRVSVDETSLMGVGCSVAPAISGDGETVAYRTHSSNLYDGGAAGVRDLVESKWRCVAEGSCRILSSCPAEPSASCAPAARSRFVLLRHPPGGTREDRVSFRWQGDRLDEEFPDPRDGTEYHLCLYAGDPLRVEMDVVVPSDGRWRELSNGHRLVGGTAGITGAILRNGDGRSRITLKGKGPLIDSPDLPLSAPNGVTVQIHEIGGERCFSTDFPIESIRRNLPGDASTAHGRDGRFAAQIR